MSYSVCAREQKLICMRGRESVWERENEWTGNDCANWFWIWNYHVWNLLVIYKSISFKSIGIWRYACCAIIKIDSTWMSMSNHACHYTQSQCGIFFVCFVSGFFGAFTLKFHSGFYFILFYVHGIYYLFDVGM